MTSRTSRSSRWKKNSKFKKNFWGKLNVILKMIARSIRNMLERLKRSSRNLICGRSKLRETLELKILKFINSCRRSTK